MTCQRGDRQLEQASQMHRDLVAYEARRDFHRTQAMARAKSGQHSEIRPAVERSEFSAYGEVTR